MERRTFFKVIGALAASAAIPSTVTALIEASQPVPAGMAQLGLIREMFAADIARDECLFRYDVLTSGREQFFVTVALSSGDAAKPSERERVRKAAKCLLEDYLAAEGISWADLKPLPVPPGYKAPRWTA